MKSLFWPVPRCCPVDDAPHTTCTSADYHDGASVKRIVIVQLPARDAQLAAARPAILATPKDAPAVVTLQPGEVTTATYRRQRKS